MTLEFSVPRAPVDADGLADLAHLAHSEEDDLSIVLDEAFTFLTDFVAFPSTHAAIAVTLWAAHTHVFESFDSTPRLAVLSPEKGSGKTRVLEVLECLVREPLKTTNISPAVLYRVVEKRHPTILLDECDGSLGPNAAKHHEDLRTLVNAGHRRGDPVYRCVGDGAKIEMRSFETFTPVALAGIGNLPDTIIDRSVVVRMRRRKADEKVLPFRCRDGRQADPIREALAAWAGTDGAGLEDLTVQLPAGIEDRAADVWEPLLAIAQSAGTEWARKAADAAQYLNAERAEMDASLGVQLLRDLRIVFDDAGADVLGSASLRAALYELTESPWEDLSARRMAQMLRPFDVRPGDHWIDGGTKKGYRRSDLEEAWERYLPASPSPSTRARSARRARTVEGTSSTATRVRKRRKAAQTL